MLAERTASKARKQQQQQQLVQPEVIELSNDEDFLADADCSAAPSSVAQVCCEGEAALRPDDELVLLNYSMVPHRVGDIFVHTKQQQLVASPGGEELRPMASFLGDIGLAMVLHHYSASNADKAEAGLPAVTHLLTPYRYRCASCPFRSDTELAVVLHYQQGHISPEGLYRCALDKFSSRDVAAFRWHMGSAHGLAAFPQTPPAVYQCELCVSDCATPSAFYQHSCPGLGPRPLAPDAVEGDQPVACCLQLDSLHLFGVTELHGRLVRGTFYGKRIVMSPAAIQPNAAAAAAAAVSASWQPPIRTFSAEAVRIRNYAGPDRPPFVLCELCHGACRSIRALARHLRAAHGLREPPDRLEAALRSPAGQRCFACRRRFLTRRGLTLHLAWAGSCHCEARPACRYCSYPAADAAALCAHLRTRHPHQLLASLGKRLCPICPPASPNRPNLGGFPSTSDLLRHLDTWHGLRSANLRGGELRLQYRSRLAVYECHACPARFASPQTLDRHAAAAAANSPAHRLACRQCASLGRRGVQFFSREVWLAHQRVAHSAELDSCPICSKRFQVGPKFISHVMQRHLRPCSVQLTRLPD